MRRSRVAVPVPSQCLVRAGHSVCLPADVCGWLRFRTRFVLQELPIPEPAQHRCLSLEHAEHSVIGDQYVEFAASLQLQPNAR